MKSKKNSSPIVNIGSSSLLVIFIVLCLVTFATLSLSSAQSDYKFSQRLADRRSAYYTASNQAEEVLDEIDSILAHTYEDSRGTYYSAAQERLEKLNSDAALADISLDLNFSTEAPTVTYIIPVTESQALSVILAINPADESDDGFYQIRQWKVISTSEWEGDQTLKLIK